MKGLSQRVLERKAKRRRERINKMRSYAIVGLLTLAMAWNGYYLRKEAKAVGAPSWAEFKVAVADDALNLHEYNRGQHGDGLPNEITVNGERWDIVIVDHFKLIKDKSGAESLSGIMAETDCVHRLISYIPTSDPMRLKINLMHEVFHAGACLHQGSQWWNSPDEEQHVGIYHLGEFMATFAHDNPGFVAWEAN